MRQRRFAISLRRNYIETPGEAAEQPELMTRTHALRRRVAARIPDFSASLEWLLPARFAGLVADLSLMPLLADTSRPDDGSGIMPWREFSHAMTESSAAARLRPSDGPARGATFSRWMLFAYAPPTGSTHASLGIWAADPVQGSQMNWLPIGTIRLPLAELRESARGGARGAGTSLTLRPAFAEKL